MKKAIYLILVVTLLLSLSFVSAAYSNAPFNHRYQGPSGSSSADYYNRNYNDGSGSYDNYGNYRYNLQRHATVPIFKGGYGNYRYQMYANGDYRPNLLYSGYGRSYNGPYYGGGINSFYGGYGRYGRYNSFGIGVSRYFPSYSYNNYGSNYYPSYDYQYIGGCGYSYC